MAGRSSSLRGQAIELTAIFLDAAGDHVDPDIGHPFVLSIYPPDKNPENGGTTTADAWVYDVTTSSMGSGPYAVADNFIEKLDTGSYRYTFTIPADATLGAAFDRWEGYVDDADLDEVFSFTVVGGGSIGTTQLYQNNVVFIRLDSTIIRADDESELEEDYESYFTTTYNPLYTTVRRVRLDLGSLIAGVPDDTINLAIFESSIEVDALSFGTTSGLTSKALDFYNFAKRQYTTCSAELILLNAISGDASTGGGKKKSLADLSIAYDAASVGVDDLVRKVNKCKTKWEPMITSAGQLGPGTSHRPQAVVKGYYDPDRPKVGRDWAPSTDWGTEDDYPAANTLERPYGSARYVKTYRGTRWNSRFSDDD